MSRRPSIRDLEQKLKAALLELKASKEMCDCLISERDDHETEIRSVIFMNTKLKGELAEMDVKCNDLTDQRDRLQVPVSERDDCRNHYEQSLLQIQVLQEEVHIRNINMDKLQHELDLCRVNETVRLYYEIKLFERDSEYQSLQDQMGRLQNNLAELTAPIEPRNFNYTLDIKLNSDMSDDGLNCTASNKKTEQSIAHNNENVSMPESVTSALHVVTNNENETVIYSDELGSD
ncbi:hypothetical protein EVAR_42889_1 [Eumeta japonica]|uniref:Uncharacterized protein n=1 Tax=Eumeta variegata TaxID=151549 RepID=A0A4C1YGY1_EUMVA|nr:hypothetical protein EVAR_42889_1 [Eumeta japonica]